MFSVDEIVASIARRARVKRKKVDVESIKIIPNFQIVDCRIKGIPHTYSITYGEYCEIVVTKVK